MIQETDETRDVDGDAPKWFNSPVTFHEGTLADIGQYIPDFERRGFGLGRSGEEQSRLNARLDTIVRQPFRGDGTFIPVGVVSKDYVLVPHTAVLDVATKAFSKMEIDPAKLDAEMEITEYGERMALSLYLPEKYSFDPGDGNPMALRLECVNSVDGSTRFRALMGWYRFVCCNGLVIGVTRSDLRRRHFGYIDLEDVGDVLTSGLKEAETEKKNFREWRETGVTLDQLKPWVNEDLRKGWGFKAAARTFHIARFGIDADVAGQYKDNTPTSIPMRRTNPVPGTPPQCRTLFDLSQILAWLAQERRDVQEQLKWREQIPELMKPLIH
jgi:hypothetical protein